MGRYLIYKVEGNVDGLRNSFTILVSLHTKKTQCKKFFPLTNEKYRKQRGKNIPPCTYTLSFGRNWYVYFCCRFPFVPLSRCSVTHVLSTRWTDGDRIIIFLFTDKNFGTERRSIELNMVLSVNPLSPCSGPNLRQTPYNVNSSKTLYIHFIVN